MTEHQHVTGGVEEDGRILRLHLSRDHGVEPGMLVDPAEWHRKTHRARTSNEVFATLEAVTDLPPEPDPFAPDTAVWVYEVGGDAIRAAQDVPYPEWYTP